MIFPVAAKLLDELQLLDITREGCLGAADAALCKRLNQLRLGLNILLGNDLHYKALS